MARSVTVASCLDELGEFLSSRPNRQQLLTYRPSKAVQKRAEQLLRKQNDARCFKQLKDLPGSFRQRVQRD